MYCRRYRSAQRVTAIFAIFAMLFVALMPTVSRAVALINGDATMFQTLCASGSVKLVMVDARASDPAHQLAKHMESCGYCVAFGHDAALLPTPNSDDMPLMAYRHEMPARFYSAAPKLHAWSNSQARAPPLA
jgi:Protein of unknown function (DUF2946)